MNTVLTSTVIAAIVTGFLTLFTSLIRQYKDSSLIYITSERQKWREKIRNFAVEINNPEEKKIGDILTELKMNINTYGINSPKDYMQDGHIWEAICNIENKPNEIEKYKPELIAYLSLLVKYDWDRAKKEARKGLELVLSIVLFIISAILFSIWAFCFFDIESLSKNCLFGTRIVLIILFCVPFLISLLPHFYLYSIIISIIVKKADTVNKAICPSLSSLLILINFLYFINVFF